MSWRTVALSFAIGRDEHRGAFAQQRRLQP
jgi:hypothetical protein